MSYATDVKTDIARAQTEEKCCAMAEVYASMVSSGAVSMHGGNRYSLQITSSESAVLRHYFALIKEFFGDAGEIRILKSHKLGGLTYYQLAVPEDTTIKVLGDMGFLTESGFYNMFADPSERLLEKPCCRRVFVFALFLLAGTVSNPDKEYHLEFAVQGENTATLIEEILREFEIPAKKACRKGKEVVYLHGSGAVVDALTLIGANKAMFELENIRIAKELRNTVNRQMNCDASNVNRALMSSEKQIEDINYIDERIGITNLPETLREIAVARIENPELSLTDLGKALKTEIGKSGVNARMRRISALAEKLKEEERR